MRGEIISEARTPVGFAWRAGNGDGEHTVTHVRVHTLSARGKKLVNGRAWGEKNKLYRAIYLPILRARVYKTSR